MDRKLILFELIIKELVNSVLQIVLRASSQWKTAPIGAHADSHAMTIFKKHRAYKL